MVEMKMRSGAEKNLFHVPENAERKIFRFGARKEKKSNQNEKNLRRKFWFCGVRIEGVAVPKLLWQVSAVSDSPFLFPQETKGTEGL